MGLLNDLIGPYHFQLFATCDPYHQLRACLLTCLDFYSFSMLGASPKASMQFMMLLLYACLCHLSLAFSGFSKVGGHIKLLGSSFGVLGKNETFDYVVSGQEHICTSVVADRL